VKLTPGKKSLKKLCWHFLIAARKHESESLVLLSALEHKPQLAYSKFEKTK
jgi:hypothetical protein